MRRPAREHRYQVPTRADLDTRLVALIEDETKREVISEWASEYVTYDDPQLYPTVEDPVVWRALVQLGGADIETSPGDFLHGEEDFRAWLRELRSHGP